ncbi:MAG: preprotein translocase subunit SecE [Desulfosarcinaceae bacterium]|nr:preprotein translocase subunit SecE [Desulfosarcinaceae bacterium]
MGRLQRKKDPKKKKAKADQAQLAAASSGAAGGADVVRKPAAIQRRPQQPPRSVSVKKSDNFFEKSMQFLREVKIELKKVTWPSRKQAMGSTVVVIVLVMIISAFLGLVDVILNALIRVVLQ